LIYSGSNDRDEAHTWPGGFIARGTTSSHGAGDGNVWLIKTDKDGNKLWNKTFGGSGGDSGKSVQQNTDGGFIVTGMTAFYSEKGVVMPS
jgi:hypothetical protein